MPDQKVAFYGGSFNPPTVAHRAIVDYLCASPCFDRVIVKPCGWRRDKPELLEGMEQRRQLVLDRLGNSDQKCELDVSAMEHEMVATVVEWEALCDRFGDSVYIVAGTDLFVDEGAGRCQVQRWVQGERLYREAHFFIFPRPWEGELLLPERHLLVDDFEPMDVSSSQLRNRSRL